MTGLSPGSGAVRRAPSTAATLKNALRGRAEVVEPTEAEEPILAPSVRAAVFGWLQEINAADDLRGVGLKPRTSALLSGPPGCGKTTLAHHLAARLGIPMVNVGSEMLFGPYLGESERNAAGLFDAIASAEGRCVLFLDEIDAIGGTRSKDAGGGAQSARNSMLTVLLRRIEGFQGLMIAATNRPDSLDPALWRRFAMQIDVALPDSDARWAILKRYGEPFAFEDNTLDFLTDLTDGAAPSLLRQLMEGVKRLLVMSERSNRAPASIGEAVATIVAMTKPHPDYEPPPLWSDPGALKSLPAVTWPPERRVA